MNKPIEVKELYDNQGETIDRYSIYICLKDGFKYLICCCSNPTHPQGVFSRAEEHQFDLGKHLGKKIKWEQLPKSVQKIVIDDI